MNFWTEAKTKSDVERVARQRNQSVSSCLELAAMQFVEREDRQGQARADAAQAPAA